MKKRIGFFAIALGLTSVGFGQQDKHYSMFAESPVYMNPAAAGFAPGSLQLFSNFRMQWASISANPYKTTSLSADWRMMEDENFMGAGVNFQNDVSGDGKYKVSEISVPVNYAIKTGKDQHFAIGLQPGWYQRSLNEENLSWDNQWTGTSFNTSLSNGESIMDENRSVSRFDISAGAYWKASLNRKSNLTLGLSVSHLGGQKVNFLAEEHKLYRKIIFHSQFTYKVNEDLSIIPAVYTFFQGPNREITLGSNFRYLFKGSSAESAYFEQTAISLGLYVRTGDALMINVMFDMAGFTLGAAYDLNTSGLSIASNGNGAFEFFLRYRLKKGK